MKKLSALCFFLLFVHAAPAQWVKIASIPTQEMIALAAMQDTLYVATSGNLLYRTKDNGASWQPLSLGNAVVNIYAISVLNNIIYVGTANSGMFVSYDFANTWQQYANTSFPVSGFATLNQSVYAATVGDGVYRFDTTAGAWVPFNNQLPSNLAFNVNAIVATPGDLLIGAGANGDYYQYNFLTNQWVGYYYYGNLLPGLQMLDLLALSDTLFATNGNRIIRSNNGGTSWADDNTGSRNGVDRKIASADTCIYTLTNLLSGGAWIQRRDKHAPFGADWSVGETFLPTGYAYDLLAFRNKLYIAKDDGLYVNDPAVGINYPHEPATQIAISPNPVRTQTIQVISPLQIERICLFDALGQQVFTASPLAQSFSYDRPAAFEGFFVIVVYTSNGGVHTERLLFE